MVSVNPGTSSSSGVDNPAISNTVVVVAGLGRVVDVVSMLAASVAGRDVSDGTRLSHPRAKAATATAASINQPLGPALGGVGRNSGSIETLLSVTARLRLPGHRFTHRRSVQVASAVTTPKFAR